MKASVSTTITPRSRVPSSPHERASADRFRGTLRPSRAPSRCPPCWEPAAPPHPAPRRRAGLDVDGPSPRARHRRAPPPGSTLPFSQRVPSIRRAPRPWPSVQCTALAISAATPRARPRTDATSVPAATRVNRPSHVLGSGPRLVRDGPELRVREPGVSRPACEQLDGGADLAEILHLKNGNRSVCCCVAPNGSHQIRNDTLEAREQLIERHRWILEVVCLLAKQLDESLGVEIEEVGQELVDEGWTSR